MKVALWTDRHYLTIFFLTFYSFHAENFQQTNDLCTVTQLLVCYVRHNVHCGVTLYIAVEYSGNMLLFCTTCHNEKPLISTHAEEKDITRHVSRIVKSDY